MGMGMMKREEMDENEYSRLPPILVSTQSIDIHSLDFKSQGTAKRNITCVETTNLYLFVGFTSGTVYVFHRESLQFKFIIPFKGGKVCNISCADDETDVAISSIRGNLSIYRIYSTTTTTVGSGIKHLYTLGHHIENEITEMQWSANGRFLFIGDNCGIISQVDIGCLNEFPRPVPSKIILRVNSRVMQLAFTFPYLAISALAGSFLCDIETEEFIRIQNSNHEDIKSSGILLYIDPVKKEQSYSSNREQGCISCIIAEIDSNGYISRKSIHDIEDPITRTKVESSNFCFKNVKLFNPTKKKQNTPSNDDSSSCSSSSKVSSLEKEDNQNMDFTLRKLYLFEEYSLLITASTNRLLLIDPKKMEVLLWTDDFQHIHAIKLISNYLFIWNGSKLDVIALTQFQSYGEQLFKVSLQDVLENLVFHCLDMIQLTMDEDKEATGCSNNNDQVITRSKFLNLMGNPSKQKYKSDAFIQHISSLLPFQLYQLSKFESALSKLIESSKTCAEHEIIFLFITFYHDIDSSYSFNINTISNDKVPSLSKIEATIRTFIKQPQILNFLDELSPTDYIQLEKIICRAISFILSSDTATTYELCSKDYFLLTTIASNSNVSDWFEKLEISKEELYRDTLVADYLIYLSPLLPKNTLQNVLISITNGLNCLMGKYFTWFVTTLIIPKTSFENEKVKRVLEALLNLDLEQQPKKASTKKQKLMQRSSSLSTHHYYAQFISTLSLELLDNKNLQLISSLQHIITSYYLTCFSTKASYSALLKSFPSMHLSPFEERAKLWDFCKNNRILLLMFYESCLDSTTTTTTHDQNGEVKEQLCSCGLPNEYKLYDNRVEPAQKRINLIILDLLIHFEFSEADVQEFAMKTLLYENFFEAQTQGQEDKNLLNLILSVEMKAQLIIRTSSCSLLSLFKFTPIGLNYLVKNLSEAQIATTKQNSLHCSTCSSQINLNTNFQLLSWDCLAYWIYSSVVELDQFIKIIDHNSLLNLPNRISLRFYQFLISSSKKKKMKTILNINSFSSSMATSFHNTEWYPKSRLNCQIFHASEYSSILELI